MVKNRKKALKLQMKRAGLLTKASAETPKTAVAAASKPVVSKATLSLEEFAATEVVAGLRANLLETLYEAGVKSPADFKDWTEKDLLALKGVGPATIKKLQENGVKLKK